MARSYEFHLLIAEGGHAVEESFRTIPDLEKRFKELRALDKKEAEPEKPAKKGKKK